MTIQIADAVMEDARNAAADVVAAECDGGKIELRTGAPPAETTDADSGTLLAELTLSGTAFAAASLGEIVANSITADASANATGTAGYFRIKSSGGTVIIQGTVGEADDDPVPDLILTNASITSGQNVAAAALSLTF